MIKNDLDWLFFLIVGSNHCLNGTRWFLFGSVLRRSPKAEDIDILIVYESPQQVSEIRRSLRLPCLQRPLHLTFLGIEEEAELDFIAAEQCVEFFPINRLVN